MGAHLARRYITETDTEPDPAKKFEFDPQYGFPERKERGLSLPVNHTIVQPNRVFVLFDLPYE